MKTNPNEPISVIPGGGAISVGLTKREYFAAMAMQGLCVNTGRNGFNTTQAIASSAIDIADALIEELNKENK